MTEKIALITGANKGIGFETARQLGEQGYTVYVGARSQERGEAAVAELEGQGFTARFVQLDVTDQDSVDAAARTVAEQVDHLDVLVNNAGVPSTMGKRSAPSATSIEDMKSVYEINVFGIVRVTNAFLPLLKKAPAARIVNMSSEVGSMDSQMNPESYVSGIPAVAQYPSSKAAVNMLTVQYAKELREEGIKVNAANPGFTATDFTSHRGVRPAAKGAEPTVYLATLGEDGPTGILYGHTGPAEGNDYGVLAW